MIQNGIKFGTWHSFEDGGLYTIEDEISYPEPSNVNSDISNDTLPYILKYNNREMRFSFLIPEAGDWQSYYNEVSRVLEGKILEIVRDIEPEYTYIGLCTLDKMSSTEREGIIGVRVIAQPYKLKSVVTEAIHQTKSQTITVDGNYVTPAIITINPTTAISKLTISGLARDPITGDAESIVINSLKANTPVTIDGEKYTVIEAGVNKFKDTEFWEYPTLAPGNQTIKFSVATLDATIKYKPRFI